MKMILRKLTIADEKPFLEAIEKWVEDPGFIFAQGYELGMAYMEFLETIQAQERGERLPQGWVPMTSLFGFQDGEIIGRLSIRHTLSDFLLKIGGHIGYGVLPEYRRRGFAVSLLKQSLPIAADLGINRALLTCDDNNIGSIKTIEACGGILENTVVVGHGAPLKRRYWIVTSA
jgi:predicted acetyltransferase